MSSRNFDIISKEQFKFLESDYGFTLAKSQKKDWGYELIYINKTVGVKITYEFKEAYIFIMLYKLLHGNLIENPRNIQVDTLLYGYSLDDIINYRDPSALIKPAYQYGEESKYYDKEDGLILYVSAFASNLKEYGADILSGDFKSFSEVDKIVKERIKKYQ